MKLKPKKVMMVAFMEPPARHSALSDRTAFSKAKGCCSVLGLYGFAFEVTVQTDSICVTEVADVSGLSLNVHRLVLTNPLWIAGLAFGIL